MTPEKRRRLFVAGLVLLFVGYVVTATAAWSNRGWADHGPLSYTAQPLSPAGAAEPTAPTAPTAPAASAASAASAETARVTQACRSRPDDLAPSGDAVRLRIVSGTVDGSAYLACYGQDSDGDVTGVVLLTADRLTPVTGDRILRAGGAWPWVAVVRSPAELVFAGATLALIGVVSLRYHRRREPAAATSPWWAGRWADAVLTTSGVGVLALWLLPGRTRARKAQLTLLTVLLWTGFALVVVDIDALATPDPVALTVAGFLSATLLFGCLGGRYLVRPAPPVQASAPVPPTVPLSGPPTVPLPGPPAGSVASVTASRGPWPVHSPASLPSFAQVGGLEEVKAELRQNLGSTLAHGSAARAYGIRFNGILLHGRPGHRQDPAGQGHRR